MPLLPQLYWFTTYNTDREGNAADGRPAPGTPAEAKADALASVAGWIGGVEAAIQRTDEADITRNRVADRRELHRMQNSRSQRGSFLEHT